MSSSGSVQVSLSFALPSSLWLSLARSCSLLLFLRYFLYYLSLELILNLVCYHHQVNSGLVTKILEATTTPPTPQLSGLSLSVNYESGLT